MVCVVVSVQVLVALVWGLMWPLALLCAVLLAVLRSELCAAHTRAARAAGRPECTQEVGDVVDCPWGIPSLYVLEMFKS